MTSLKYLVAGAVFAASAGVASAAPVLYADAVLDVNKGTCVAQAGIGPLDGDNCAVNRDDPLAALGAPDGDFYALGFGGDITLGFSGSPFPGGETTVYEVTFDRTVDHDEAVDLYSVLGGVATYVATIFNSPTGTGTALISGDFDSIKLVDVTADYFAIENDGDPATNLSFDGFDVAAVGLAPIPLPAAGLMLLAGLGGLGALRRKSS